MLLSKDQQEALLNTLKNRFDAHPSRHPDLEWASIQTKIEANPAKLGSLHEMEKTGGEPDIIGYDEQTGDYLFCDCSPESPAGRRSLCYDPDALASRKENKPVNSALGLAASMGVDVLNEEQYRDLQRLGVFDVKTSSWVKTPDSIRKQGGALFCDRRYDRVFAYHNGAESYYASRGFRGLIWI
jgi:hypothetical protein